jgi:hypothetical protein
LLCTFHISTAHSTVSLYLSNCTVPGTSIESWGVTLTLSKPSQYVCVVPSTVVNSTLLIGSEYCQNYATGTAAQCTSRSGNTFDIGAAGTSYNASTPSIILAPNSAWTDIPSQTLLAGTTSLYLPSTDTLPRYPIGIITSGNNQNTGHLGLESTPNFSIMR